jgi:mono/diheme cytochrome c family protein
MKILAVAIAGLMGMTAHVYAADAAQGKRVYEQHCSACHGESGTANAAAAKALNTTIADLKSLQIQQMSEKQLKQVITEGKGKMPPIKDVTGSSLDDVIAYLHSLKK